MRRRLLAEQLPPINDSKQMHKLFSVVGWRLQGHAIELIIAKNEADAKDYAVRELGFIKVDNTSLASDCVHIVGQVRNQN
jgi:predicted transcriptional regulator